MTMNPVHAPRGKEISCKAWPQEAALRCLMNNLDPDVAERPDDLIVYGGRGKAARNWECFHAIVRELQGLGNDETLLIQSGKPVAVFRTHDEAPRVLIANSNLVGAWSNWSTFDRLEKAGLIMYGQMTAGSWIYIGSQGIVQGTYETFAEAGRQHYGDLRGRWILTAGLGGMGGAQPLAATFAHAVSLTVECQQSRIDFRLRSRHCSRRFQPELSHFTRRRRLFRPFAGEPRHQFVRYEREIRRCRKDIGGAGVLRGAAVRPVRSAVRNPAGKAPVQALKSLER